MYKIIQGGYVIAVGVGHRGIIINKEEYDNLVAIIENEPTPPEGFVYRLRADTLEWELVELPPVPEHELSDDEALTRYANEMTDGNAETLQEATENLIKIVKEDK